MKRSQFCLLPVLTVDSLLFPCSCSLLLALHLDLTSSLYTLQNLPKYHFFQRVFSNHDPSLTVRIPLFGMLFFIPVLSVNTVSLAVKLLLSWKRILEYSCLPLTSLWNMLNKFINEGNKPKIVLLVKWALFVSWLRRVDRSSAVTPLHPRLSLWRECLTSTVCYRELLILQCFFFPRRHFSGVLQSLGCKNFSCSLR